MLVPVHVAHWEVECCQPHVSASDAIGGPLYLAPGEDGPGPVDLDVSVVRSGPTSVVEAGGLRLGVDGELPLGAHRVRGSLRFEWHGGPLSLDDGGLDAEPEIVGRGTVRRVQLLPWILVRAGERSWAFDRWGEPFEVASTEDLPRFLIPPADVDETVRHDFLLDVDLSSAGGGAGGRPPRSRGRGRRR